MSEIAGVTGCRIHIPRHQLRVPQPTGAWIYIVWG